MTPNDKYADATLASRRDLGPDLWAIRIAPEVAIPFRPGQYVTVGLEREGRIVERPYSIVSAPDDPEIELFVERVPEGELSVPLWHLQSGARVLVRRRAKGLFLKDAPVPGRRHLLVATVTGVAPYLSLIRTLISQQGHAQWVVDGGVTVLHGASVAQELGYEHELRALDGQCPWLTYVPTVSRPWNDPGWNGETGRVEDILRKYADLAGLNPGNGTVFLCGNPAMIHNARGIMRRRGFGDNDIREEQYWPE